MATEIEGNREFVRWFQRWRGEIQSRVSAEKIQVDKTANIKPVARKDVDCESEQFRRRKGPSEAHHCPGTTTLTR
jgi:hypothetical protein